jgi:hypothetical protein
MNDFEIKYLEKNIEKSRNVEGMSEEAAIKALLILNKNLYKEDILSVNIKENIDSEVALSLPVNHLDNEVTVVDVKIPFWSMIVLLMKLALASIPAAILIGIVWSLAIVLINGNF